jgi:hypothetical protein
MPTGSPFFFAFKIMSIAFISGKTACPNPSSFLRQSRKQEEQRWNTNNESMKAEKTKEITEPFRIQKPCDKDKCTKPEDAAQDSRECVALF